MTVIERLLLTNITVFNNGMDKYSTPNNWSKLSHDLCNPYINSIPNILLNSDQKNPKKNSTSEMIKNTSPYFMQSTTTSVWFPFDLSKRIHKSHKTPVIKLSLIPIRGNLSNNANI